MARINFASADYRHGYGTGVTRVHDFIRAPEVDPRGRGRAMRRRGARVDQRVWG